LLLGGFFHGRVGFGCPMFATPLLSLLGSGQQAVLTTLRPTLSVNATSILSRKVDFGFLGRFWPLGGAIILGSWSGTQLLVRYESDIYKLLLALMVVLYLYQSKLKFNLNTLVTRYFFPSMLFFGVLSGLVSGLVNVMIPVLIIYVLELKLEKEKAIILLNFCFFSSKVTQVATFSWLGVFTLHTLLLGIPLAGAAVGALLLGKRFTGKIDTALYEKILKGTLWVMVGMLLLQYAGVL
jgi:hypothetical protein